MGVSDNNTTGKFTNHEFSAIEEVVEDVNTVAKATDRLTSENVPFILADLPMTDLLMLADSVKGQDVMIFNISAKDDDLRGVKCRSNIIHVVPSRRMLSDAVMQYLVWKQWRRLVLVKGIHEDDNLLADAYKASAKKFGAKIISEQTFNYSGSVRGEDGGSNEASRQVSMLTQALPAHDVIVVADEGDVFAGFMPFRTSEPELIVGSAGLIPRVWDAGHEQWGAIQLQNRFIKKFKRRMGERDASAWLAVRIIGEAASRSHSSNVRDVMMFILSSQFSIAAFKGSKLTIRDWDHQLRQPILLADGRGVVSVSPQEGFLHEITETDTLGVDWRESRCKF